MSLPVWKQLAAVFLVGATFSAGARVAGWVLGRLGRR
jgi:hypothetical protein